MYRLLIIVVLTIAAFAALQPALGQGACSGTELFTASRCVGDEISQSEKDLFELLNKYRTANGKPALKLSGPLSMVANRRMLDIRHNMKMLTHSWSNCNYDIGREDTWGCVLEAPTRFKSGYNGRGMETLFRTTGSGAIPAAALEAWKKSSLHNSIILNLGSFASTPWDEAGVAIEGQYAAVWFGSPASPRSALASGQLGLGTTYDEAARSIASIAGLAMQPAARSGQWTGATPDGKLVIDLSGGPSDAARANLVLTMRTARDAQLDFGVRKIASGLLSKIFPEWVDAMTWLDNSVSYVANDPSGMRSKAIRKLTVEMKNGGSGVVILSIKPAAASVYREF